MALRSTYGSSGALNFTSDSTSRGYVGLSSQVSINPSAGGEITRPIVTGSTSAANPAHCHLVITSTNGALVYDIAPPTSPFGQELSIFCVAATTVNTNKVRLSTDASVTIDGTNGALTWSTGSRLNTPSFHAVAISSQRWHAISYSTSDVALSTN